MGTLTAMGEVEANTSDAPPVLVRIPPHALLDLHRLATLREVARRGSYSAAAESLNFTPSAVSQQMTGLARELGFQLFDRTPWGMRLTTAAEVLIAHLDVVFAQLNEAQAELDDLAGGVRGRLRIGSFTTATVGFVADTLGAFADRFPGVRISLADGQPHESVARLRERELDLALVFDFHRRPLSYDPDGRLPCQDSEIECVELFDDPFVAVLPRDHPLALHPRTHTSLCEPLYRRPSGRRRPDLADGVNRRDPEIRGGSLEEGDHRRLRVGWRDLRKGGDLHVADGSVNQRAHDDVRVLGQPRERAHAGREPCGPLPAWLR